jgi:Ca2+-binding EF-hand superfamily protein
MSEYESNDMDIDYGEPEEQNEDDNEENYQGEEENNSNYNNNNNYNNYNNSNNNNNYNNINNNNNNKNKNRISNFSNNKNFSNNTNNNNNQIMNSKMNNHENEEEEEQEQDNTSNNVSSKKTMSNKKSNKSNNNRNNTKNNKNQYGGSTMSQDNNTLRNEKEDNIEENGGNPEILYEEFFNYFLPAKKHTLNIKECKNTMRCLGLVVTEKEILDFFEIKEKTGKEKINLEDFKAICNKKLNETNNNLDELEQAFEMLDPEKTGIVDSRVLRHQMKVFKPKMTDEEVNQILSEFGEDKNGNLNYREYIKNLKG